MTYPALSIFGGIVMSKFCGIVGFAEPQEIKPSVYKDVLVERKYQGDVEKLYLRESRGSSDNSDLKVSNIISILADPYINHNFLNIRFVEWMGVRWMVESVDASTPPRLKLTLGGTYNE